MQTGHRGKRQKDPEEKTARRKSGVFFIDMERLRERQRMASKDPHETHKTKKE